MFKFSAYFGLEWRAVVRYYNVRKTLEYFRRYHETMKLIDIKDKRILSQMHTIYLFLCLGTFHQIYMFICGDPSKSSWKQLILFDFFSILGLSPLYSLHFASLFLLAIFMFAQLYNRLNRLHGVIILSEIFLDGQSAFLNRSIIPSLHHQGLVMLNVLQYLVVFMAVSQVIVYFDTVQHFIVITSEEDFTLIDWIYFVFGVMSMHIFYIIFYTSLMLFIHISETASHLCCIICLTFFARLKQIYRQHLQGPIDQFVAARLMRYVKAKHSSMQFLFSVRPHFCRIFTAYLLVNVPLNVTIVSMAILGQLNSVQLSLLGGLASGQLTAMTVLHALAAYFSNSIFAPYKRVMSLNIVVLTRSRRSRNSQSIGELIKVNHAIQMFHVKNMYGIHYGFGVISFGLVRMITLVKFFLLYGEFIMFQYVRLKMKD